MVSPPAIRTERLTKQYGSLTALADCTIAVDRGEVFGLLGPNGAGKSTLLRLLLGLLRPTAGSAFVESLDCHRESLAVRRKVAYLPGDPRLFRHMSGRKVLDFFADIRPECRIVGFLELAERLELDLGRRVASMSTGMRQKLALVVTLGADTPIVILDEPTSNLDPTVRREVMQLVAEAKAGGRTVLFSSHVLPEVEQACDRVGILKQGRLVHLQVTSELRRCHRIHLRLKTNGAADSLEIPATLQDELEVRRRAETDVELEARSDLTAILKWLATLPLEEVRVEPVGLRAVYDRFHPAVNREA